MQLPRPRGVLSWTPSLVLALVVLAAACALPPPPPPPDGGGSLHTGHVYASTSVTEYGHPRPLVLGTRITMSFAPRGPQNFTATAGCSTFGGLMTASGGRLLMQVAVTTYRPCDLARSWQDIWLYLFLSSGPMYSIQDDQLRLQVGGTVIELIDRTLHPDRTLIDTEWRLKSVVGQSGEVPLPSGTAATIVFGGSSVEQDVTFKYCNIFEGPAQLGPGPNITIGSLQRTWLPCGPGMDAVEFAVAGVLSGTISQEVQGDVLTLTHPSGGRLVLRAVPLPPPPPLEGTEWRLQSFNNGVPVPLPTGTGATLTITPPTLQVQIDDCNRGQAQVEVNDSSLRVGPVSWTEMACQPGPAEVEAYVWEVLQGSSGPGYTGHVQFEIGMHGGLTLSKPDSYQALVFRAA